MIHTEWTPSHGRAKVGQPARNNKQRLCADTGYSLEDLPEVIDDREGWQVRIREINTGGVTWYIYIYIYIYEDNWVTFQNFFVWVLLLIVHKWKSRHLRSNLLRLQCTCCTVPTIFVRSHGSPLVGACKWPSSKPISSPQLSHNDSLWA